MYANYLYTRKLYKYSLRQGTNKLLKFRGIFFYSSARLFPNYSRIKSYKRPARSVSSSNAKKARRLSITASISSVPVTRSTLNREVLTQPFKKNAHTDQAYLRSAIYNLKRFLSMAEQYLVNKESSSEDEFTTGITRASNDKATDKSMHIDSNGKQESKHEISEEE